MVGYLVCFVYAISLVTNHEALILSFEDSWRPNLIFMDVNVLQVCRKCGLLGYYSYKLKTSYCSMCKNGENIAKMTLPYACKLLFQVLWRRHLDVTFITYAGVVTCAQLVQWPGP